MDTSGLEPSEHYCAPAVCRARGRVQKPQLLSFPEEPPHPCQWSVPGARRAFVWACLLEPPHSEETRKKGCRLGWGFSFLLAPLRAVNMSSGVLVPCFLRQALPACLTGPEGEPQGDHSRRPSCRIGCGGGRPFCRLGSAPPSRATLCPFSHIVSST